MEVTDNVVREVTISMTEDEKRIIDNLYNFLSDESMDFYTFADALEYWMNFNEDHFCNHKTTYIFTTSP